MVYDLSTGGVRLCGLPRARVGDEVGVRLQLPRDRVYTRGYLLRVGSSAESPDFAIEFFRLSAKAEDAIHDAVIEALSHPEHRSLLLVGEQNPYGPEWEWLDPVSPICATATTPLEAVQCLEKRTTSTSASSALGVMERRTRNGLICTRRFLGEPSTMKAASVFSRQTTLA